MKPASVFVLIACVLLQVVHSMPVHQAEERALALVDADEVPAIQKRAIICGYYTPEAELDARNEGRKLQVTSDILLLTAITRQTLHAESEESLCSGDAVTE
ncbi:hypothetical protein FOMPIDRAFT_1019368 [Fomitopsis schrenkii]|uniref:Uncharacterized protein n=1 Tax=Fomitopsis schrenkii TaxID=2126942 RepID=S8FAJ7_FOMSC|nr:hypothetical protein FOMPIDRAFT_1019368 [Fomitopsis schrenkii]